MKRAVLMPCLLLALVTCSHSVFAEIAPVIINLKASDNAYTVPADKVLLIEHGYVGDASSTESIVLIITNTSQTAGVRVGEAWFRTIKSFNPSLKIPSGWTLSVFDFFNIDSEGEPDPEIDNYVLLFGLLVDPQDLYAGIPNQINTLQVAGLINELNIELASPRPRKIEAESSTDLETWTRIPDLMLAQPFSRLIQGITVSAAGDEEFIRTRVRSTR
ncbi:MAG TPA: hypothetical protein PJ991_07100 [Kiritimatiellia bacterium]|nr:hypothetical protein [Kiritimatiellia bacterium]